MVHPLDPLSQVGDLNMQTDYGSLSPGDNMLVRQLPCVECDNGTVYYTGRRLCISCYRRGAPAKDRGRGRLETAEVFDLYAARDWVPGCWVWLGHISRDGYGKLRLQYAHRLSHELHKGPIPEGLHVDHLCRNRWCVNPDHLEPVTPAENVRRWAITITHCPQGHGYTPENTSMSRGKRQCRECRRLRRQRIKSGPLLSEEKS